MSNDQNNLINIGVPIVPISVSTPVVNINNGTTTSPTNPPGNTVKTWTDFLNTHGSKNYKWKEWDCFTLCKSIRQFFNQPDLPNFDYIYQQYDETSFPNSKLKELMVANCKTVVSYQDFDLVLIRKNELDNIGTFYQGKIIYMGARYSVCSSLENILPIISKIYRYPKN